MKKLLIILLFLINIFLPAFSATFEGGVMKEGAKYGNKIIDSATNAPIENAKVTMPQKQYRTYSDSDGRFDLGTRIDGQTILSVEKDGYKPFSMTIDERMAARPMVLGIEKTNPHDLILDSALVHLGDNNFSSNSANSNEFRANAVGPFFSKSFKMSGVPVNKTPYLTFGSIIGVDTEMAKSIGQNRIYTAFSSPPEVYFNGQKIAEIQINGDNQRIKIPKTLILANQANEVTIKTGRNLMQTSHVDYDDFEFMNLSIEYD